MLAVFAEFERELLRAIALRPVSQPPVNRATAWTTGHRSTIRQQGPGPSSRWPQSSEIARRLNISRTSVRRFLALKAVIDQHPPVTSAEVAPHETKLG
jgi:hypothetical protein